MKKILKYCIIYIFILMSIQYVSAINASNYDFNYGDLNTIGCAQNAANSQNEIGYTPTPFSDSVASSAFARMTNDNIFFFNGHGNSGLLRFANDSGDFSYITAKNMAYPYISSYSNHELDDLLLAVYVSCHSGTDNVVWGNLLDESVKSGVDTALGFHGLIKSPTSSTWSNKFWENIQNGYTVADAAHDATDTVSYWNGIYVDPQGLENWTIKGSAFVNVSLQKTGVIEDNGNLANRPAASYTVSRTSNPLDVRYQFTDTSTNSPTKFYWYFDDGTSSNETNPSHGFPSDGYYTITHTATNQYGTGRGAQSQYLLHSNLPIPSGPLDANFLPTAYNGMAPLTVRFIDLSPGNPTSWRWNFGFDYYSSSIEQNPVYTYTRERDMPYTVDLTVKDSGGNLDAKSDYIAVSSPLPSPVIAVDKTSGFVPLTVQFTDANLGGPGDIKYEFGDGAVSYEHNALHNYTIAGNYTAKLIITNNMYQNIATKQILVLPPPPAATFTASPTSGPAPLTVTFTDTSGGNPALWTWNFGDGNATNNSVQHPVHTYWANGLYTVSLTVTGTGGSHTATRTSYIEVTKVQKSGIGVFRNGSWLIDANGNYAWDSLPSDKPGNLGQAGNNLTLGDWNGDTKTEIGIFNNGTWYLDYNGNGVWDGSVIDRTATFGQAGDVPIVGDWNNNGKDKIGFYRDGLWAVDYNGNYAWDGPITDRSASFGGPGTIPVIGDWNGDGNSKIGFYQTNNSLWAMDYNGNYAWEGTSIDRAAVLGAAGAVPVIGDWNGDGRSKLGFFANGLWAVDYNGNYTWDGPSTDKSASLGQTGDIPVVEDWNGDGKTEIGMFQSGLWAMDYNGNFLWEGAPADTVASFGLNGDSPLVGRW